MFASCVYFIMECRINEALVKRIIDDDPEQFRVIIQEYRKLVSHIVHRLVDNPADREELGQEIFIKIFKNLPSFKFQSNMATWITKITYNACLNFMRKKKIPLYDDQIHALPIEGESAGHQNGIEMVLSPTDLQDDALIKNEVSDFLYQEINALPVQYRKIITFYHLNQKSHKEIGELMKLPEGTIKSYLFRARKILKERLLEKYNLEELCL